MLKKIFFISIIFFIFQSFLFCKIDIGEEVLVKTFFNVNYSNFGDSSLDTASNTMQRVRIYLAGNVQDNIEAKVKFQSIGIWGASTDTVKINNYFYDNFTPFIEEAYIKTHDIFKLSKTFDFDFDFVLGKQKIFYGDGYILSDNDRGLFAYKLEGRGKKSSFDLLAIKAAEKNFAFEQKAENLDVYAAIFSKKFQDRQKNQIITDFYIVSELGEFLPNLSSKKIFAGMRLDMKTGESVFTKIEAAQQFGDIKFSTNTVTYDGLFYDFDLKVKLKKSFLRNSVFKINYMESPGTQNSLTKEKDTNFEPYLTNNSKDFSSSQYCEILSRIFSGLSNRRILNFGINSIIFEKYNFWLDYYRFWRNDPDILAGTEFDLRIERNINEFIKFRLIFAFFNKNDVDYLKFLKNNIQHYGVEFSYNF